VSVCVCVYVKGKENVKKCVGETLSRREEIDEQELTRCKKEFSVDT
jgi:hypothetical protein